jgi:PKHD-type hydroxylase
MSVYAFTPMPPTELEHHSYVTWENGFTEDELLKIEQYCDANLEQKIANVGNISELEDISKIRISKTAWIQQNEDTQWFYDRMAWIARKMNSLFYKFDLYGFVEDFQYTIYQGEDKGHYEYHIDSSPNDPSPRKFSIVLQLSDPLKYTGGELQILTGRVPDSVPKVKGLVCGFPSFRLHKVTQVTSGVRKTIVIWVAGPAFR